MNSKLLRNVDDGKKGTFIKQYEGNKLLFRVIRKTLEAKVEQSRRTCDSIEIHEYPTLAHILADHSGFRRALQEVIDLLPDNKERN